MEQKSLEICPYYPSHRIPANKLQYHLAPRRKKNPKIAKKMANCKYNVYPVVPIKRLKEYKANCVDRTSVDNDPFNLPKFTCSSLKSNEEIPIATNQIPDHDVWNVDTMTHFPPFVLKAFAPKMLVCESNSKDPKAMTDKQPNKYKS
ncbi:gametocyte-specific factor 1-like [Perognathus longimembris pacificus]|uniref:gametocyte-specific factor 1-like n=1 Tax=Perognathus longimembris pacificus TaxID=214514 RepID=UPI002019F005|nr:gametocyte-specific factor 1-like [Perognathus longimembris pacificus]